MAAPRSASPVPVHNQIQLKNTFYHFDVEFDTKQLLRRARSAPELLGRRHSDNVGIGLETQPGNHGAMLHAHTFRTAPITNIIHAMMQVHHSGRCKPCSFFALKADGCRLGLSCQLCHVCTAEEVKQKKRSHRVLMKAMARRLRSSWRHCTGEQP